MKENECFLLKLLEKENLNMLYDLTFYNEDGIIYQALSLISGLLIKDELSWQVMENIPLIDRIGKLLTIENLSIPIRYVCLENLINLLNNHKDEIEILEDVKKYYNHRK